MTTIDKDHLVSVGAGSPLNLNWELVSHCQFNCSYCYYRPFKSNTDYRSLSKIVLRKIAQITDPTKVTLLGGEPTLHPRFREVIEALHNMNHVTQICLVTNFEKPLGFWQDLLPFTSKLKIVVSFHPEYEQRGMFEKIKALEDDFLLDFVFIVHNQEVYLPKMQQAAMALASINYTKTSVNFVRLHQNGQYHDYPPAILSFMLEQQAKLRERQVTERVNLMTTDGALTIPKFEMINQGLNQFQGWNCKLRAFIIKEDGMVASACSNISKHILLADFNERLVSCPYKICECDDYWEFPKTRV